MSENRNREIPDFSKYDTMTAEELEEILRQDSEAPEEQESDTERMLYIMGVLADRTKENTTGKTAFESWKAFQQDYLCEDGVEEQVSAEIPKPRKARYPWLRRSAAVAAVLALAIGLTVTASAFGWDALWNTVATWVNGTFSFSTGDQVDTTGPSPQNIVEYASLQEALRYTGLEYDFVPTWIPDGYQLQEVIVDQNPVQSVYGARYKNGEQVLKVTVRVYASSDPEKIEINDSMVEIYRLNGVDYYIFSNNAQLRAVWMKGAYECNISGELTVEELKTMIDSIGKG